MESSYRVSQQEGGNRRGAKEHFVQREHLKLSDLKERAKSLGLVNSYLSKENIPGYPRPELHVPHLKHDTEQGGLRGIRRDEGFRNPGIRNLCVRNTGFRSPHFRSRAFRSPGSDHLLWWSLAVGPDDIEAAERRLLEKTFPDRTEEQVQRQQGFLGKFATSPAFQELSMYGSYRFTFPLEEMLKAYSKQFCSGRQPVMRVYETILFRQQVMYVVLVHSPDDEEKFSVYPLLTDGPDSVCSYRDGCFIWRPEAMCETHRYDLYLSRNERQMEAVEVWDRPQFYVWDHVALALHVDKQVLKFDAERLRENLKFCDPTPNVLKKNFDKFDKAKEVVKELWPDFPSPLERTTPLNQVGAADPSGSTAASSTVMAAALSGSGPTVSGSGPTVSGSGPTVSGSGPTVSGSGPTVSGSGPTVAGCRLKLQARQQTDTQTLRQTN